MGALSSETVEDDIVHNSNRLIAHLLGGPDCSSCIRNIKSKMSEAQRMQAA